MTIQDKTMPQSKISRISWIIVLMIKTAIFISSGAIAQTDCWDFNQGPIWEKTFKNEGINGVLQHGDFLYITSEGFYQGPNFIPSHLKIMDLSNDPKNPTQIGYLDMTTPLGDPVYFNQDMIIENNRLFICSGSHLLIYDISDPTSPQELGHYSTTNHSIQAVAVKNDLAVLTSSYMLENHYISTLDISDPANTILLDIDTAGDDCPDVAIHGNYALVAAENQEFAVWSLHDPTNILKIREFLGGHSYRSVEIQGNIARLAGPYMITLFDISDPSDPLVMDHEYFHDFQKLVSDDSYFYTVSFTGDLAITEILPNGLPSVETSYAPGPGFGQGVAVYSGVVYLANHNSGLNIFNPRVGPSALSLGHDNFNLFHDIKGVATKGPWGAFITHNDFGWPWITKLNIVDLSNPDDMPSTQAIDISNGLNADHFDNLVLVDNILCLPAHNQGLYLFDWTDPQNAVLSSILQVGTEVSFVSGSGSAIYLSTSDLGLIPVDISDPVSPVVYPNIPLGWVPGETLAMGNRLFLLNDTGLQVATRTVPFNPNPESFLDIPQVPSHLVGHEDHVFVAGQTKVYVVDTADSLDPEIVGTLVMPWIDDPEERILEMVMEYPYAYISLLQTGIVVADFSNLENPVLTGIIPNTNTTADLALSDDHIIRTFNTRYYSYGKSCDSLSSISEQVTNHDSNLGLNAWPNPFNPMTTLSFDLPVSSPVSLDIFDLAGRRVANVASGMYPEGRHELSWQGADNSGRALPSGVYFARLKAGGISVHRRLALIR